MKAFLLDSMPGVGAVMMVLALTFLVVFIFISKDRSNIVAMVKFILAPIMIVGMLLFWLGSLL